VLLSEEDFACLPSRQSFFDNREEFGVQNGVVERNSNDN